MQRKTVIREKFSIPNYFDVTSTVRTSLAIGAAGIFRTIIGMNDEYVERLSAGGEVFGRCIECVACARIKRRIQESYSRCDCYP